MKPRISPRSTDCADAPGAARSRPAREKTTASAARNTTFTIFIVALPLGMERSAAKFEIPECANCLFAMLFTRQARIQELEKYFGVDAGADLDVGIHVVNTFDDVAIAVQHVAFDGVVAIGDGFTAGVFTARFHVHVHCLGDDNRSVDRGADG